MKSNLRWPFRVLPLWACQLLMALAFPLCLIVGLGLGLGGVLTFEGYLDEIDNLKDEKRGAS